MLSKIDKIKLFQSALGSYPDGLPGESTWDAAYRFLMHEGYIPKMFPYANEQWGSKVVFSTPDRIKLIDPNGPLSKHYWSMSGSFTYPSGEKPCSIMVNEGKDIFTYACHYYQGKPETVLYYTNNGDYGLKLCKHTGDLPEGVIWAIGGAQLIRDGKPAFEFESEGFTGIYSDVKRTTAHNAIGFDKFGNVLGVYHNRCSADDLQRRCFNIGMVDGIMLDGGHISAINCGELKANINQKQGYAILF